MSQASLQSQRKLESAAIAAAGDMARSGRYDFEGILAALEKAGFANARTLLSRPHLRDALDRILHGAKTSQS